MYISLTRLKVFAYGTGVLTILGNISLISNLTKFGLELTTQSITIAAYYGAGKHISTPSVDILQIAKVSQIQGINLNVIFCSNLNF